MKFVKLTMQHHCSHRKAIEPQGMVAYAPGHAHRPPGHAHRPPGHMHERCEMECTRAECVISMQFKMYQCQRLDLVCKTKPALSRFSNALKITVLSFINFIHIITTHHQSGLSLHYCQHLSFQLVHHCLLSASTSYLQHTHTHSHTQLVLPGGLA